MRHTPWPRSAEKVLSPARYKAMGVGAIAPVASKKDIRAVILSSLRTASARAAEKRSDHLADEKSGLSAFYGDFQALFGIDFEITQGETIAIIGANGAGKSTFLKSVTGLLKNAPESIEFKGCPIGGMPPGKVVSLGVAMVPEGRRLFPSLSVEENLLMGGYTRRPGPWTLDSVYALFPVLRERRNNPGTALSGGQQQMVAIGRALMSNPDLLICDEISLGLAPIIVKEIYSTLDQIRADGLSVIVVEQDVATASKVSNRLYCFQEGRVSLQGPSAELSMDDISKAYFGI